MSILLEPTLSVREAAVSCGYTTWRGSLISNLVSEWRLQYPSSRGSGSLSTQLGLCASISTNYVSSARHSDSPSVPPSSFSWVFQSFPSVGSWARPRHSFGHWLATQTWRFLLRERPSHRSDCHDPSQPSTWPMPQNICWDVVRLLRDFDFLPVSPEVRRWTGSRSEETPSSWLQDSLQGASQWCPVINLSWWVTWADPLSWVASLFWD